MLWTVGGGILVGGNSVLEPRNRSLAAVSGISDFVHVTFWVHSVWRYAVLTWPAYSTVTRRTRLPRPAWPAAPTPLSRLRARPTLPCHRDRCHETVIISQSC